MKKRGIMLSALGIILISLFLITIVLKDSQETFVKDGVTFAMTLDGNPITSFPAKGEYRVTVSCDNAVGQWLPQEWELIIEKIKGEVTCRLDFTSNPETLVSLVESVATDYDTVGFRYSGLDVNNYIWFNNELWRIIGSVPTCTSSGCATSENLIKIIRVETIGSLAYDGVSTSSATGEWGSNTLYTLLNSYYVGKGNASSTKYCYKSYWSSYYAYGNCDFSVIGIDLTDYYGSMIEKVYWNSGKSSFGNTPSESYTLDTSIQTIQNYVGLMSPSDIGYSATCDSTVEVNGCGTSWMASNVIEWTMHQHESSSYDDYATILGYDGTTTTSQADRGEHVRPVVYLDPTVYVVSGDGSYNMPYQIAMP